MKAVFGPMFDAGLGEVPMALYFERYSKEFAPDWPMFRDLYLVRNVLSDVVAERAAALGVVFPD